MTAIAEDTVTLYAKVIKTGDSFEAQEWFPWINVKPSDMATMPQMILHRWIRNRGGVYLDESFEVTVYTYDENTPCYASGKLKRCNAITFQVGHKDN